ncbi:IAA-amino acid hydrolase ILR1-like protein [Sesbania bispinosa]|nr:IAA-amino acid hydrolase ILR1-like protein [Sesbania bispinosa]
MKHRFRSGLKFLRSVKILAASQSKLALAALCNSNALHKAIDFDRLESAQLRASPSTTSFQLQPPQPPHPSLAAQISSTAYDRVSFLDERCYDREKIVLQCKNTTRLGTPDATKWEVWSKACSDAVKSIFRRRLIMAVKHNGWGEEQNRYGGGAVVNNCGKESDF